ncbi:hypothetical protein EG68_11302 [Paragonimus skrjabini miyazakii]|uniref:NR LBD domain-containing protein n=1 Tax=Paragonimus skrjabini miyazakii TaxID=59628 RepID=A0A8S9Y827_9TREM|nr:hypothetical protein EG68_11302 [Paragonimus skrjabini miyazakii]
MQHQTGCLVLVRCDLVYTNIIPPLPIFLQCQQPRIHAVTSLEPARKRPTILKSLTTSVTTSGTSTPTVVSAASMQVNNIAGPISVLNFTGDVIQLAPLQPQNFSTDQPQIVRLFRMTPAEVPGVLPLIQGVSTSSLSAPPCLRPCAVCQTNTANVHADIAACPKCEAFFHHMLDDLSGCRKSCTCRPPPTKTCCGNCRIAKASETALAKWGCSLSERAKKEWSILDNTLDLLAGGPCTLDRITKVHDEQLNRTYGTSALSLKSPNSYLQKADDSSSLQPHSVEKQVIPSGSFKRRAVDQQSWVQINSQQIVSTHPVQLSNVSDNVVTPVSIRRVAINSTQPLSTETEIHLFHDTNGSAQSNPLSTDQPYPLQTAVPLATGDDYPAIETPRIPSPMEPCTVVQPVEKKSITVSAVSSTLAPIPVQPLSQPAILIQACPNGDPVNGQQLASSHMITDSISFNPSTPISIAIPVTLVNNVSTPNVRKETTRTLLKDDRLPVAILPKPSTSTTALSPVSTRRVSLPTLSEGEVLSRRLSRLIKPSFMQVYVKHYNEVRNEPRLADIALDNHATLFQLFEFYDWEWNQPIEVSQSVRQACWAVFHEQLNESLTDMVRFIKRIPGFPILKPQDRILLVRNSGFELAFMVHYLYWNSELGTWHGPDHFVLTLEQLLTIFPAGELFFRYGFANAERLCKFTQQLQHLGLVAALVILNSELPSLSDRETVEALRERILNAVKYSLNVRYQDTDKIVSDIELTLRHLRDMGREHRILLECLKVEDRLEFPDDLYAELFKLIGD